MEGIWLLLGLKVLIIAFLLIGIIVCVKGMKTKNVLYKGGFYFFLLLFIEKVYSLIVPTFINRLIDQGIDNPGLWVRNSTIPPLIFTIVALVIFIIFLFKGLNDNSDK